MKGRNIVMPRLVGYQACARIRRDPRTSHAKVLMLTICGRIADLERARAEGAHA